MKLGKLRRSHTWKENGEWQKQEEKAISVVRPENPVNK